MSRQDDYDVVWTLHNDTPWTCTYEAWGNDNAGRANAVVVLLQPHEHVSFMVNASLTYFYCVRIHGLEVGFHLRIRVDTACMMTELVPNFENYQALPTVPWRVQTRQGITVQRFRILTRHRYGW